MLKLGPAAFQNDSIMKSLHFRLVAFALLAATPALGANDGARLGRRIAQNRCAACHLIDNKVDGARRGGAHASPNPSAPPFQVIAMTYDPSDLEEALAEGIVVGHNVKGDAEMPEFALSAREAGALVAYLQTLRRRRVE